jgi:hypothetical protein
MDTQKTTHEGTIECTMMKKPGKGPCLYLLFHLRPSSASSIVIIITMSDLSPFVAAALHDKSNADFMQENDACASSD